MENIEDTMLMNAEFVSTLEKRFAHSLALSQMFKSVLLMAEQENISPQMKMVIRMALNPDNTNINTNIADLIKRIKLTYGY